MAKKDLTLPQNAHVAGSRSQNKIEHEKALNVLEKAKTIPRKAVFLKQGDCEFSKNLRKSDNIEEMLNSLEAANFLGITYHTFAVRQSKKHLPFVKRNGNKKYFKVSDLSKFKSHFQNA